MDMVRNVQKDIQDEFASKIRGELIFPESAEYEKTRKVYWYCMVLFG